MTSVEFQRLCSANGVELDHSQLDSMVAFVQAITGWNDKINLISRKDSEHIWERHILHSVVLLFTINRVNIPLNARIADIGTGGGFPGIPLKICRPDLTVELFDSIHKKIAAVNAIIAELAGANNKMQNIHAVCERVEEASRKKEFAHTFDAAVARAVAPLDVLARWAHALVKQGGNLIALKGGDIKAEITVAKNIPFVRSITSHGLDAFDYPIFKAEQKKIVVVTFR